VYPLAAGPQQQVFQPWLKLTPGALEDGDVGFNGVHQIAVSVSHNLKDVVTVAQGHVVGPFHRQAPFIEQAAPFQFESLDPNLEGVARHFLVWGDLSGRHLHCSPPGRFYFGDMGPEHKIARPEKVGVTGITMRRLAR
jgi:hypothetical protein